MPAIIAPIFSARADQPYAARVIDEYTRTKSESEPWLLQQNDPNDVMTCAIRPPGIWGSGRNIQIDSFVHSWREARSRPRSARRMP